MEVDEEGFRYPEIKDCLCMQCGICKKVCPMVDEGLILNDFSQPIAYAAINKDREIKKRSSSGGIFTAVANSILSQKGIVFGASMDTNCKKVIHIGVEKESDLDFLRGSKYVQSDIHNVYQYIDAELEKGRKVLFSGTPCQIAGLKKYLKNEKDNLLTIEVICHGVPSPMLWEKYISYIEKKLKSFVSEVKFRDNSFCKIAGRLVMHIKSVNGKNYVAYEEEDPFYSFFLKNFCLRPSCYQCRFKGNNHMVDITLGDFWGSNFIAPYFCKDENLSLIFLHTDKGRYIFENIKKNLECCDVRYQEAIIYNPSYVNSVLRPKERELFFVDLENLSFRDVIKKYHRQSIKSKLWIILEKNYLLDVVKRIKRMIPILKS